MTKRTADPSARKRYARLGAKGKVRKPRKVLADAERENKYSELHPTMVGMQAFIQTRWYELQQQIRSRDPEHTRLIKKMYRMEKITVNDLKMYNLLSTEEVSSPESPWLDAPVIVSTNSERCSLIDSLSRRYGELKGRVILQWPAKRSTWKQRPPNCHIARALQDPSLYEYAVEGSEGFITQNINQPAGLVNGTAIIYRGVIMETHEQTTELQTKMASVAHGTVITLPCPPKCVVVEIPTFVDPENTEKDRELVEAWKEHTLLPGRIVIPIKKKASSKAEGYKALIKPGRHYAESKVTTWPHFPMEPAFAITVHKAQGCTLKRIIIALSPRGLSNADMSYAQVYVGLSRVREKDHIRFLLNGSTEREKWESLSYLTKLSPDESIAFFFSGYGREGEQITMDDWEKREWTEESAYTAWQRLRAQRPVPAT